MKALSISRICLVGMLIVGLAVGLFIESSVWSPHVLRGKELLNVRGTGGPDCQLYKSPKSTNCPSNCTGSTRNDCSGDEGTATKGCYIVSGSVCGQDTETGEPCNAMTAGWCDCYT